MLEKSGLEVVESIGFPDHYLYRQQDLESIVEIAKQNELVVVATKKDWVKFPKAFQKQIAYLDIELEFENKELIKSELKKFV